MRTFIMTEMGKAFGRLKGTIIFIVKAVFIALVNVAFWFLPLFLMGYFVAKPVLSCWKGLDPVSIVGPHQNTSAQSMATPSIENKRMDLESVRRSVRSLIRDLQIWDR